ncbi:MAG: anhydro-N-acetylmuramic acid kinase [Chloroflexi bacterium]|nr:anhydro-N-acetylmuramic acid kinase [Chloroflexota bacterium]
MRQNDLSAVVNIIGLISGTSADGIDAALCDISGAPPNLTARIVLGFTLPYPADVRERILAACLPNSPASHAAEIARLHVDVAEAFAAAAQTLIDSAGITPEAVDLIASHGQTVWHEVRSDGSVYATLQLGESAVIAERTGITTISNFRPRDIAAGGQGAPLTAYADWLLLRHPTHWRAIQNIGGIGNVTLLPPHADEARKPLAFDTGPGNALIDSAVTLLTNGAQPYDVDGDMAAAGVVAADWLAELLQHPYFRRVPPKTTGRELFGSAQAADLVAAGGRRGLSAADIVATLTALTAHSSADAYRRFAPVPVGEVIIGGGGVRNPTLIKMLRDQLGATPVITHEAVGLSSDHKEALVMALLAHETWHLRPGTLPALTGATHPTVLGHLTPAANTADLLRRTWG